MVKVSNFNFNSSYPYDDTYKDKVKT